MAFTKAKKQFINIIEGKNNIKIPDLMKKYPDGIHVIGATVIKAKKGDCSAWLFQEDENLFFFGGKVFTDTLKEWIEEKGSIENVNTEMKTDAPLMKIIGPIKTKEGNEYFDFEI